LRVALNGFKIFSFHFTFREKKWKKRIIFKKEVEKRSFKKKRGKRGGLGCQVSMDLSYNVSANRYDIL
jgi:hypothetical protein